MNPRIMHQTFLDLAKKAVQISGTVVNGKVVDPIAEPFKYEPNTLSMKSGSCSGSNITRSVANRRYN